MFPSLYSLDGNTHPERPKQLSLIPFEQRYSNKKYYSGVKVSIQPPTTAGVNFVKGFELSYSGTDLDNGNNKGDPRCIIFSFTVDKLNATFRYSNFSVEVYPVTTGLWSFTAYSLPKPPTEEDTTEMFRQSSLVVKQYGYNASVASVYWYTTITYHVDFDDLDLYGSIVFSFVGSSVYDFPRYKVQLYRVNEEHPIDDMLIPKDDVPIAPDHPNPSEFACKDEHGFPGTCLVTSTSVITVGDLDQASPSTSNRDSTYITSPGVTPTGTTLFSTSITAATGSAVTRLPDDPSGKILASVLGVALGLVLIAITAYCFCQRRSKNLAPEDDSNNKKSTKISANCFHIPKDEMEDIEKDKMKKDYKEQTLLLTYHTENNYHDYAVQKLGEYLRSNFCWDITVEPCSFENLEENSSFRKSLQNSHVVVMVISPGDDVQLYVKEALNARNRSVYQIAPKLVRASFDYHSRNEVSHSAYTDKNDEFKLMPDTQKLIEYLSTSGMQKRDTNTLDRKGQKSKLNDLEKAVNLAIQFYRENHVVDHSYIQIGNVVDNVPDSYDSGYHERHTSLEESTQPQKLDSISNVLEKNRRLHTPDTAAQISDHYVMKELYPSVIDEHPSLPFEFHEPSEVFSTNDVSTLAMQQEICDLNERNMYPEGHLCFPHVSILDEKYCERYDDECISVGSGKSV
ncbi:hypothetical protein FSP39_023187 [Pinctada imbricata]|uniref:SEFIR domain-containing protein n=1 Tax=Pinctada imbricata TaxID=66713 RepID=A0AA89C309_PINIB|nr:hypothetical protein FSP39_023187 [Pinctada imbricata]